MSLLKICKKEDCNNPSIIRGKYCEIHRTKKKIKIIKGEKSLLFLNDDVLSVISSYLTIYENYQLLFIARNFNYIIDWNYLQKRDYPHFPIVSKYNAINLDNGNIFNAPSSSTDIEEEDILITKTDAMNIFKIPKTIMNTIQPEKTKQNPIYHSASPMLLYKLRNIQVLSAKIYNGLTNLKLHKEALQKITDKKREKYERECQIRFQILKQEFDKHKLVIREDSMLCEMYIKGLVKLFSVEEIGALVYLTQRLFKIGGHVMYSEYNEIMKEQLYTLKSNYPELDWYEAVDAVIKLM